MVNDSSTPVLAVELRDLDRSFCLNDQDQRLAEAIDASSVVVVGVVGAEADYRLASLIDSFDVLLSPTAGSTTAIDVDDLDAALDLLERSVAHSPEASVALVKLLRLTHDASIASALHAESLTYAMLQTGNTFQAWLAGRNPAELVDSTEPAVLVTRGDSHLEIVLNRPHRRNALNVEMRDGLHEALQLLAFDASLDGAVITGAGSNFSAGGDLDEFGTTPSPAIGHEVRSARSLPMLVHQLRERVRIKLHGTCVGAGIELPAFSQGLLADEHTTFRLPEIGFGLVPGAGGTVSVTRRCGRHRAAWMALTGSVIDARTALNWQLIDRITTTS